MKEWNTSSGANIEDLSFKSRLCVTAFHDHVSHKAPSVMKTMNLVEGDGTKPDSMDFIIKQRLGLRTILPPK